MSRNNFEFNGTQYRMTRMPAMLQAKILKRVTPILSTMLDDGDTGLSQLVSKIHELPDEDLEFIVTSCLQSTTRIDDAGHPWPMVVAGKLPDIDLVTMFAIIREHMGYNFNSFFDSVQQFLPPLEMEESVLSASTTMTHGSSDQ